MQRKESTVKHLTNRLSFILTLMTELPLFVLTARYGATPLLPFGILAVLLFLHLLFNYKGCKAPYIDEQKLSRDREAHIVSAALNAPIMSTSGMMRFGVFPVTDAVAGYEKAGGSWLTWGIVLCGYIAQVIFINDKLDPAAPVTFGPYAMLFVFLGLTIASSAILLIKRIRPEIRLTISPACFCLSLLGLWLTACGVDMPIWAALIAFTAVGMAAYLAGRRKVQA